MTAYLENEDERTDVTGNLTIPAVLLLMMLIGVIIGLFVGTEIGKNSEHDRICNSPQPPFSAPVAIPACGVDPR